MGKPAATSATGSPSHRKNGWRRWKASGVNTTCGGTAINRDFKEFIQSLNGHDVRYLVVGGYAVAYHGHPRYTKHMDVWVWMEPDNADRLLEALNDFGFGGIGLKAIDFLEPGQVIQLGYPPNRIDILTDLKGVTFPACWERRVVVDIDGTTVNFIDLPHLKANKRATGRHQDLADLENLA